jgi:protocatechuate 3,4-dioxygenase beta subunit
MSRTNNLGDYGFKTIFPGFESETRSPHINIIITHKDFGTIDTEIYFQEHPMNKLDPIYMSYSDEDKQMLTAKVINISPSGVTSEGKIATFNVIMDGIHPYKKY